jgi:hypothetical protein
VETSCWWWWSLKKKLRRRMTSAEQLVLELIVPEQRENALLDLSKVELLLSLSVFVSVSHSLQRFRV